MFGGLILNRTGNFTGNLVPVTSELGTLGLPGNVLSALANVSLTNGGAYAPPHYNTPPPPPPWWQTVGSVIYNTLSGVTNAIGLTTVVSIVWNGLAAAEAYVAEGATWLSNHLGITKLVGQFAANLRSLMGVMVWALDQVLNYIYSVISGALSTIINPILTAVRVYTEGLTDALWAVGNDTSADRSPASDGAQFYSIMGGSVFVAGFSVAFVLTVVLNLIQIFSLGVGVLIPLIIGVVLTGPGARLASAGGPSHVSAFAGIGPDSPAVVNGLKSITGWTQTTDGSGGWFLAALGTVLGMSTTSWAVTEILSAWEDNEVPEWTDTVGAALGIIGLLVAVTAYTLSSIGGAVASFLFDSGSVILDGFAIKDQGLTLETGSVIGIDISTVLIDLATV